MTIGVFSPISTALLAEWMYANDALSAARMATGCAPAVTTLAQEFLKMGHRVVVYTLSHDVSRQVTLRGERLAVHILPGRSRFKLFRLFAPFGRSVAVLRRAFRQSGEKLDVVSAHWTRDYAVASGYFRSRCPVFVTVRDIMPYIIRKNKPTLRAYALIAHYLMNEYVMRMKGIQLVANSEYTAESVKRYWGHDAPVIYNPIKDEYLTYTHERPAGAKEKRIVSISISAPDDNRKNMLTLVKAFQLARMRHGDIRLLLVGQGFTPHSPVIQKWRSEGLLDGVELLGATPHDKVLELLAEADLMVHPSHEETFGNTLIEAMACECPVIGGRHSGAVPYVLRHGQAGVLSDVSSPESLAADILAVLSDEEATCERVALAKRYCVDTFSSRKIAEKYIQLFQSSINE